MHAVLMLCRDGQLLARAFERREAAATFFREVNDAVMSTKAVRLEREIRELRFGWLVNVEGADSAETAAAAARSGQGSIVASTIMEEDEHGRI